MTRWLSNKNDAFEFYMAAKTMRPTTSRGKPRLFGFTEAIQGAREASYVISDKHASSFQKEMVRKAFLIADSRGMQLTTGSWWAFNKQYGGNHV